MEYYIEDVSNITYMSELIPHSYKKEWGINSPKQLTFISFRKLWAH
jgi:hypothetical protein